MTPRRPSPRSSASASAKFRRRSFFRWHYVQEERRRTNHLAVLLFWSVLLFFGAQRYIVSLGVVRDYSMSPTLSDGEYFLVNRYAYYLRRPRHGEIVVLGQTPPTYQEYVKRVVALEGEVFRIQQGRVYLNGRLLEEPYALGPTAPDLGPLVIPQGCYFVLGDNRSRSEDSRVFGPVPLRHIRGHIRPGKLFAFE